jgi:putative SOS response-associated peptidase YedK
MAEGITCGSRESCCATALGRDEAKKTVMCARMSLGSPERLLARFGGYRFDRAFPPRYNLAPTQAVLALKAESDGLAAPLRWGLVPSWARDVRVGARMINARAETLVEKPAFRDALRLRRCLVFADGFYEWSGGSRQKQPHRFTVDGGAPFAFAGLWERWEGGATAIETCAVVTCAANALLANYHDRMPVILDGGAIEAWLHGSTDDALTTLMPFDAARMTAQPVTRELNRVTFEDPRCLEPVALENSFFSLWG